MFFPSGLPFRQPVLVGKKKKAAKKSENDKSRRESEVVSVASSSGIDALLGESSIFDDPEPENKRSGISLPSLGGLTDYLRLLQAMKPGNVGWMIGLAVPSLALIAFMTVPAFLFYTPEHKSYYYFSKGIENEPLRWVSIILATACTMTAFAYPLILRKRGIINLNDKIEVD